LLRVTPEIKQYILFLAETFQQRIIELVLIELTVAAMAINHQMAMIQV
jgi:hypothetical protein